MKIAFEITKEDIPDNFDNTYCPITDILYDKLPTAYIPIVTDTEIILIDNIMVRADEKNIRLPLPYDIKSWLYKLYKQAESGKIMDSMFPQSFEIDIPDEVFK